LDPATADFCAEIAKPFPNGMVLQSDVNRMFHANGDRVTDESSQAQILAILELPGSQTDPAQLALVQLQRRQAEQKFQALYCR
jgi:hypothetical protein